MDVRIMYGSRLQQAEAAERLEPGIRSIDILDLTTTALFLWNKLVPNAQRIHLKAYGESHSEEDRKRLVATNLYILNEKYNGTKYANMAAPVLDIETFIIRIYWLSFLELPENDLYGDVYEYLNWRQIGLWLKSVQGMMLTNETSLARNPHRVSDVCCPIN